MEDRSFSSGRRGIFGMSEAGKISLRKELLSGRKESSIARCVKHSVGAAPECEKWGIHHREGRQEWAWNRRRMGKKRSNQSAAIRGPSLISVQPAGRGGAEK